MLQNCINDWILSNTDKLAKMCIIEGIVGKALPNITLKRGFM